MVWRGPKAAGPLDVWGMEVELEFVPLDVPQMTVVLLLLGSEDLQPMAPAAYPHEEEAHMGECVHTVNVDQHTTAVLGPYGAVKPVQLHTGFATAVVMVAEDSLGTDMEGEAQGSHLEVGEEAWLVRSEYGFGLVVFLAVEDRERAPKA